MSIYYKNKNGQTNKIAGHLTQRVNARWFLLERSIEDGQEYYTVPDDQTQQYFSTMMPFTIYSFGFSETNTTATPKIKYKNEVYDIADVTALQPGQLGIGQLKGVYQMFTQESDTDKTIYFIGNMHQDFDNIQSIIGKVIQLGVEGVIDEDRVVFTVQDADSYLPYRTDLREFFIAAHLPVVVPTFQSLDPTLKVAIEFGDTVYNLYNYMFGVDTPLTIGDLMSVATHDTEAGFFFSFKATFFENSDITGFAVIPPAINATQIEHIIEDSETIVTSLTPDKTKLSIRLAAATLARLNRTLVTPMSNPPATELVAVDTSGTQAMIKLGNEFTLENGTLKANYSNATFVDYNKAQNLTEEQKQQARLNIGASSGSDVFDGQYENLTGKPILNTDNTATLPINANETIDGTISLHKVSKTGKMADLQTDANHDFISTSEKSQIQINAQNISDLDSNVANLESGKLDKTGGTIDGDIIVTGTATIQALSAETLKLMSPNATEQQPYVVVTDDQGNTLKRAIGELVGDIGGSVVTVSGVRQATYEMDNKADASALTAEVTARTNAVSNLQSQITIHDGNISSLNEAINTEASTRENADTTLTNNLNNVLNNSSRIANAFGGGFSGGQNSLVAGVNQASGAAIGRDSWVYGGGVAGGRYAHVYNDSTLNQSGGAALGESSTVVGAGGAVGNNARNGAGFSGGFDARVKDDGEIGTHYIDAIQLGTGLNETPKTLQIYDDNIYNASTHTLTVEKAEVNGKPVATVNTATQLHTTSGVQVGWYQVANLKTNGNYDIKIKQAYNYNLPEAIHLSISINNRLSTVEPFASITQLSGVNPGAFSLSKIRVRQGTDEGTTFLDVYNPDQLWNTTWVDITSDSQNVVVEPNSPFQFIGTEDNPSGYKISSLDLVSGFNTSNEIYKNGQPLAQLPKEYAMQVNTGSAEEYIHIGSFPIYDTNITVDISCSSTSTLTGRVVFPCTNHVVNTPYVYGDPYRELSSRLFYSLQNNTIDLYFRAPTYQKMMYKVWYDTAGDAEPTVDGARLSTLPATATNTIPNALDRTSQLRVGGTVATLGVVSNLNTISQPVNSTVTYTFGGGCANAPITDSGMVIQTQESTAFCTQLVIANDADASTWRRSYRDGTWTTWKRINVSPFTDSRNDINVTTLFSGDVGSGNITISQDLISSFDAIFIVGASDNNVIKYVHSIPGWLLKDIYARSQNTNNLIDLVSSTGYYRIRISSLNSTTLLVDGENARINQIYGVRN